MSNLIKLSTVINADRSKNDNDQREGVWISAIMFRFDRPILPSGSESWTVGRTQLSRQQISAEEHVMRNTAGHSPYNDTSDEEIVIKLQMGHDFRAKLELSQSTLEHFCTPCSQYEFNFIITVQTINLSCIHVKNEHLSENSTGFEFLIRLLISCIQLPHVNDILEAITENLVQ